VALDGRSLIDREFGEDDRVFVGDRHRPKDVEAAIVQPLRDARQRLAKLRIELILDEIGGVEPDSDRRSDPALEVFAQFRLGQRLRIVGFEVVDPRGREEFPGVVLKASDVLGRADRGDVAFGIRRIDDDQRIVERKASVADCLLSRRRNRLARMTMFFWVELDRWPPVGRGLEQRPKSAVLADEELREIAAEPPGSEVAAVDTDPLEKLFGDADRRGEFVVQSSLEVPSMKRRPIDRRTDLGRRFESETGDDIDVEPLDRPLNVGMFGVLLVTIGQRRVADLEAVLLERFALELRWESDEDIDVAVTAGPGVSRSGADL